MRYLWKILKSKKTVFNYDDIKNILWIENKNTIKKFFERAVKEGIFINIYKWLYAFEDFDLFELAIKIKKNSYISFETVLKKEQIIFQDYWNTVFLASDNSLKKKKNNVNFEYLKIKNSILLNPLWLINKGKYIIASKERAICDRIYLTKNYYFDDLQQVNFEKLEEISKIYNKRVILEVKKIINDR